MIRKSFIQSETISCSRTKQEKQIKTFNSGTDCFFFRRSNRHQRMRLPVSAADLIYQLNSLLHTRLSKSDPEIFLKIFSFNISPNYCWNNNCCHKYWKLSIDTSSLNQPTYNQCLSWILCRPVDLYFDGCWHVYDMCTYASPDM